MTNENLQIIPRIDKNGEPMILLKGVIGSSTNDSAFDVFMSFVKRVGQQDKVYKFNIDPFFDEELIIERTELPKEFQQIENDKLDMSKVPSMFKKTTTNLLLTLEEVIEEKK